VKVTGGNDPNTGLAFATAAISTMQLPMGADNVTATYSGDQNYAHSSGEVSVTVTAP